MARPPSPETAPAVYTVGGPTQGLVKDRGSRFLAFVYPVRNKAQVDAHLRALAAQYPDSRHLCYAYRLGADEYAADAGEPGGSAGAPILRVLHSAGFNYVLCAVIRYFGGTKLGIPGLIAAYAAAAQDALATATVVEYIEYARCRIQFPYERTSAVNQHISRAGAVRVAEDFTEICTFTLDVRKPLFAEFEIAVRPFVTYFEMLPPED